VLFELAEGDPPDRTPSSEAGLTPTKDEPPSPDEETVEDVRRHGAGQGSRWPALLLILTLLAIAAFAIWWSLIR
jgi:hypothetical protein